MKLIKYLILISVLLFSYISTTNAKINLSVSPIKYEIEVSTGSIVTRSAILYNNSEITRYITMGKSDFESKDDSGNPHFVRNNKLTYSDQELASWISIDTENFTLAPGDKKEINFTITVPDDATPGGHYGAVFFENDNSEQSSGTNITIDVDYGVLILVKVDGEIVTKGDVKDTKIKEGSNGSGWGGGESKKEKDICPLIDLTSSKYDGKCIDDFFNDKSIEENIDELELGEESDLEITDFNINFETLFSNEGNTHLKPEGRIRLVDEDGNEIKAIGKEIVTNEYGAVIGEKIVDYLPINDNGGNVLPSTDRNFESEWKGFPYEAFDETGKKIIKYWTPEEYYTRQNVEERGFLLPWERVNERINHEKISAYIDLSYIDKNGETVEFNSAKEFYVDYKEKYIGLNPYVFIAGGILLFFFFFIFIICRKKKIKCINKECIKVLDEDMKICPYCGTKQEDKRFKKNKKKKS